MTIFATDVVETSSTIGTGTYALNGPAVAYRGFAAAYVTGDTPYYVVRNTGDTKYEINRFGTFTDGSPDTLTRNVYLSSNGNAPVSWDSGDLPLLVYVPPATEVLEHFVNGFRNTTRDVWLKFGWWFDKDSPATGSDTIYVYDGADDIPMGVIDTANNTGYFLHLPPAIVMDYAGATAPSGTLLCYGQAISRTTYAKLFAIIGETYGVGDGSTTFNVPNLRGRVTAGKTNMGGTEDAQLTGTTMTPNAMTLGATGGAQTRSTSVSVSVSVSGGISGGTSGSIAVNASGNTDTFNGSLGTAGGGPATTSHSHFVAVNGATSGALGVSGSFSGSGSGSGSTGTWVNIPPTYILNKIISTGGVN